MARSPLAGQAPRSRFSKYLHARGITTESLARRIGMSPKAVEMWRCELRNPGQWARRQLKVELDLTDAELNRLLKGD